MQRYIIDGKIHIDVNLELFPRAVLISESDYDDYINGLKVIINNQLVDNPDLQPPSLENLRILKINEFASWKENVVQNGITVNIQNTQDVFKAEVSDRDTIMAGLSLANEMIFFNQNGYVPVVSKNLNSYYLTPLEYKAFSLGYGSAWGVMWQMFSQKQLEIVNASSIEDLQNIEFQ